ncbi:Bifunctional glutamate/proline--tRNA ligase [Bienertia sinuspersici]
MGFLAANIKSNKVQEGTSKGKISDVNTPAEEEAGKRSSNNNSGSKKNSNKKGLKMWELLWLEEDKIEERVLASTTTSREIVASLQGPHDILFLSETKCSISSLEPYFARQGFLGYSGNSSVNNKGGLVVNDQFKDNYVTFMYGSSYLREREEIWENVSMILKVYSGNHLLLGDLNQLENQKQKIGGQKKILLGRWFKNWTINHQLSEIPHKGVQFTWSNKRAGAELVLEQLDGAYGNNQWRDQYPDSLIWNFPIFLSDHGPIALDTKPAHPKRKRPYRLEAWCFEKPEIVDIIIKSQGNPTQG